MGVICSFLFHNVVPRPIPVAMRFKAQDCDVSFARIAGSKPPGACMLVSCECYVFSVRGL
jgi:hypothetical protein